MDYSQIAKEIRKKVIKMLYESRTAHLGSSLSIVDILTVLYFKVLSIDPQNPSAEDRDRFLLSKGHAVAALYAALAQKGFFSEDKGSLGRCGCHSICLSGVPHGHTGPVKMFHRPVGELFGLLFPVRRAQDL